LHDVWAECSKFVTADNCSLNAYDILLFCWTAIARSNDIIFIIMLCIYKYYAIYRTIRYVLPGRYIPRIVTYKCYNIGRKVGSIIIILYVFVMPLLICASRDCDKTPSWSPDLYIMFNYYAVCTMYFFYLIYQHYKKSQFKPTLLWPETAVTLCNKGTRTKYK